MSESESSSYFEILIRASKLFVVLRLPLVFKFLRRPFRSSRNGFLRSKDVTILLIGGEPAGIGSVILTTDVVNTLSLDGDDNVAPAKFSIDPMMLFDPIETLSLSFLSR